MSDKERVAVVDEFLQRVCDAKSYESVKTELTDEEQAKVKAIVSEYREVVSRIPLGLGRAYIEERCLNGATVKEILINQQISRSKYYKETTKAKLQIYDAMHP